MFEVYEELVESLAEMAWADLREWSDDELFETVIALARMRPIVQELVTRAQSTAQARAPAVRAV